MNIIDADREIFRLNGELQREVEAHKETARLHVEAELRVKNALDAEEILQLAEQGCTKHDSRFHICNCSCEQIAALCRKALKRNDAGKGC